MEDSKYAISVRHGQRSLATPNSTVLVRANEINSTNQKPLPVLIEECGPASRFAWEEFLYGKIRNTHTRAAYERCLRQFLHHCELQGRNLTNVTPADVGRYLDQTSYAPATKKLHLSALRHFFDILVTRHVIILNPAASVRSERLEVLEGKTPEITVQQARTLLKSIGNSTVVEHRDRAIIGVLIYTAARVGAVAKLDVRDYYNLGHQHMFRFSEKGGKSREIPARFDLQKYIQSYLDTAQLNGKDVRTPLFRTALRRTKQLTTNRMTANDISRMVKRRLRDADLPLRLTAHSFRVATITCLLSADVPLEDVQKLAGHADPRTTRLYDRRHRKITQNIVERITI